MAVSRRSFFSLNIVSILQNRTQNMAASTSGDKAADDSLYPIAVLIDELKNEDIQVSTQQQQRILVFG